LFASELVVHAVLKMLAASPGLRQIDPAVEAGSITVETRRQINEGGRTPTDASP
jgi:hypothetical protein